MAQYRPDAAALLAAVAEVLDDVLGSVPSHQQHQVRVAANLARLVGREAELGPSAAADELVALAELVGPVDDVAAGTDALAKRIREGVDDEAAVAAWHALVDITRRDLDVAKPGHTDWTDG